MPRVQVGHSLLVLAFVVGGPGRTHPALLCPRVANLLLLQFPPALAGTAQYASWLLLFRAADAVMSAMAQALAAGTLKLSDGSSIKTLLLDALTANNYTASGTTGEWTSAVKGVFCY
jgi:hypothetical protein